MECPKCGFEIDDNATVCPNCKKVLKIVCPKCKTLNKTNTCKRCGYVILTKCHKCGKINLSEHGKCRKCGFDLEKSVILNESNTDNFACLIITFPVMGEIAQILGSARLVNKFKNNIDNIIVKQAEEASARRQVVGKNIVIRFNKEYSFKSSAKTAIDTAIRILTEITKMNYKLTNKKNAQVKCNMFLMQRSIEDNPYDFDAGFNINMVNRGEDKKSRVLGAFQLIADNFIEEALNKDFTFDPLSSISINGEMRTFYQIEVGHRININYTELEEEFKEPAIPNFVQNMLVEQDKLDGAALSKLEKPVDPDEIYDIETINFSEIKCEFIRTENIDVFYHVVSKLQSDPKGIIAIRTDPLYVPYSTKLLSAINDLKIFSNIITVTCYDEMKYSPYSFFRNLVSAIFEYTVSQKLFSKNDFSMFASIDKSGMIRDLITFKQREDNPQDTRYTYFDIFLTLLQAIPNTLIYVENFDKIDASSYDVLQYLFNTFEQLDISYLVQYDKDFSLHRDMHYLLTKPYYTEITLKPTPFERMVEENRSYYRNIMDTFYFQRIAKYSFGSILFLDIAIQYLIESGVFEADGYEISLVSPKTLIIPSSLNKLIRRRLDLLKDYPDAIKFLATVILLGTRIDEATIKSLEFDNLNEIIDKLSDMGYIYFYNNCMYFPNYNLLRENLLQVLDSTVLKEISDNLFAKVYDERMPSPEKAYLYRLLKDYKSEFVEWEKLAKINLSLGDFNSYLNCADKILEILDMNNDPDAQEDIEQYKLELYENIAQNMFDFVPDKTFEIAEKTLRYLETTTDSEKIINLCNKLIQSSMQSGHYTHALELTHKVLSLIPNSSIDPGATNFNKYFFLMTIVHVEILFNIGAWEDCLEVGYNVLNVVNQPNLEYMRPDYMTTEQFEQIIIDTIGYVALANILQLKGNVKEFLNLVRSDFTNIPHSYDAFIYLEEFIFGRTPEYDETLLVDDNKFSAIIYHIIEAFSRCTHDYNVFAEEIYEAKILAKQNHLAQIELFADLMIGFAYLKLCSFRKASAIIYQIIKTANENGLSNLLYAAWFVMSELNLAEGKYIVTKGILNNSLIQLEKAENSNEFILMLFKYNMYKVLMFRGEIENAEMCLAQAKYLANKHGLIFSFDTDPEHYIPIVDPDDESDIGTGFRTGSIDELNEISIVEEPEKEVSASAGDEEQAADNDDVELVDINAQDGSISPVKNEEIEGE